MSQQQKCFWCGEDIDGPTIDFKLPGPQPRYVYFHKFRDCFQKFLKKFRYTDYPQGGGK